MDGAASMSASIAFIGPTTTLMSLSDGIVGNQLNPAPIVRYHLGMFDTVISAAFLSASVLFKKVLAQNFSLTTQYRFRYVQKLWQAMTVHASSAVHAQYHGNLVEPIGVHPVPAPYWNAILGLVQNVGIAQAMSERFTWGRVLSQAFKVVGSIGAAGVYRRSLAQTFKLVQAFGLSRDIVLNQAVNVVPRIAVGSLLTLLQKVLAASSSAPVLRYHLTLASKVVAGGILGHFVSVVLAQLFSLHPAVGRQFVASNSLAQLLTVHPAFTNKLVLQLVGNLTLSPARLVHMLYAGDPLLDGVVITALYVSPSGTTTTWAVNTRTNAVTEYLNYDFRSFALLNDRYIAAGSGGLYELTGDTDDGTAIIAELMSGYLQLNDKKLFGIKGAYIAIRGGGRFYLKLVAGDGSEYVYELKAQPNLMTTKVRIGKGINTTYVAFDLITEGQDFDLDSIEFIPMTRGRRV
jgi:hypothetical protein